MNKSAVNVLLKIKKDVEEVAKNADLDFLLDEIPEQIKRRTRLGKDGDNKKLKALDDDYVKVRKRSKLSSETTPKKSNLTRSGQMLEAIEGKQTGVTKFLFTFKDNRTDGAKNNEIAKYAKQKGRDFFKLSESERKQFSRKISIALKNAIKKSFNN